MVSVPNLSEKYNQVRRNYCFYLDVQDHGLSKSLSRRLQDMGLQQEVFLTSRVTHVVRDHTNPAACGVALRCRREGRARADAMLERVRPDHPPHTHHTQHNYQQLTVQKAINLLDKLYDTFFTAPRKVNIKVFTKHYIKIEFLDKPYRPVYKEFDELPDISLDPDPPKEKSDKPDTVLNNNTIKVNNCHITAGQKMTRKNRPRIKEKEEKEIKAGYCEMCNTDYIDAILHQQSQTHLAFVKDHNNFLALDTLISAGTDVNTFLDKVAPINGERRSLRNMCNGESETPKVRRSKRSQSPDNLSNGNQRRNGGLDDERKHNTRCSKRSTDSQLSEDRQYYKVVGISTKLRSSGGFTKRKDSPPSRNGIKPLVVKLKKVRRSELSVLSDEAEQFMFPKRASSTSSTSSDDEAVMVCAKNKSSPQPPTTLERKRLARPLPLALKEESSEEDCWNENRRRKNCRKRVVTKRGRRLGASQPMLQKPPEEPESTKPIEAVLAEEPGNTAIEPITPQAELVTPTAEVNPLREESTEKCMVWEDGRLKYTPAVEQLEFAFESVPYSEPWYNTFKRQDEDKLVLKNIPKFFALYCKSPKLPYEIGQLPPLKPNCCPLSDLVKRDEKSRPSRSYGTRGMKKQRIKRRTEAILALEGHPRKSPREHASTLAILGSAGLLHRRKNTDDTKSTASEDTVSDTHSTIKVDPILSEIQEASERLQQFLSEVYEDTNDYDVSDEVMEGEPAVTTSTTIPDVLSLVSECEDCDIIQKEIKNSIQTPKERRSRFKKKNRTGWPKKKKPRKDSTSNCFDFENLAESSLDRVSADQLDDTTQETVCDDESLLEKDEDKTLIEIQASGHRAVGSIEADSQDSKETDEDDKPLKLDVKVVVHDKVRDTKNVPKSTDDKKGLSSASESEEKEEKLRGKKRSLQGVGDWLQPIVRVARVDPNAARILRSANKTSSNKHR